MVSSPHRCLNQLAAFLNWKRLAEVIVGSTRSPVGKNLPHQSCNKEDLNQTPLNIATVCLTGTPLEFVRSEWSTLTPGTKIITSLPQLKFVRLKQETASPIFVAQWSLKVSWTTC